MSKLVAIAGGITGTTIIGGVGSYFLLTQKGPTFRDTFKEAIINLDSETTLIGEKLAKLKLEASAPKHPKLISAKSKEKEASNKGLQDLKDGCKEIYDSTFSERDSDLFKDFQSFCSKNIKDVLTTANWFTSGTGTNWQTRFGKLRAEGTKPSSPSLKTIAETEGNGDNGNELKKWCEKIADSIYEGETSLEFKDAKIFCGKTN